jgi:hypothetical protein
MSSTPSEEAAPLPASVHGLVRDALGNALAGVELGWGPPGRTLTQSTTSDENGAFALTDIPAGEVRLRAGGGDQGRADERVTLGAGQEFAWNPLLERGDEVSGRVLTADRKGLAGLRVELWSASSSYLWSDSTLTNEDGRFAIPNVPPGAYELHVYAAEPASAFPVRVLRPVFAPADLGEIVLAPSELVRHTLKVAALDAQGAPMSGAELRVWQGASGRGALVATASDEGVLSLAGLPAGAYRVELGGAFGWRDLGTTWLEADLELGAERFAAPGLALFAVDPSGDPAQRVSSSLWSAHPDVFGQVETRDEVGTASVPLRAGAYVLCARAAEHRGEAPLAIVTGAASGLSLLVKRDALEIRPGPLSFEAQDPAFAEQLLTTRCAACHTAPRGVAPR